MFYQVSCEDTSLGDCMWARLALTNHYGVLEERSGKMNLRARVPSWLPLSLVTFRAKTHEQGVTSKGTGVKETGR